MFQRKGSTRPASSSSALRCTMGKLNVLLQGQALPRKPNEDTTDERGFTIFTGFSTERSQKISVLFAKKKYGRSLN